MPNLVPEPGDELEVVGAATSVDLLAAALRADSVDLQTYERVLVSALSGALPDGMIEIVRERSMSDRLAGREGKVSAIKAYFGETSLELTAGRAGLIGYVARTVHDVVIQRKQVNFADWTLQFAKELQRVASEHATTDAALPEVLGN